MGFAGGGRALGRGRGRVGRAGASAGVRADPAVVSCCRAALRGGVPGRSGRGGGRGAVGGVSGVDVFVDLTHEDDGLAPYEPLLASTAARRIAVPVADFSVPDEGTLAGALDAIDAALEEGQAVDVHCWGGSGGPAPWSGAGSCGTAPRARPRWRGSPSSTERPRPAPGGRLRRRPARGGARLVRGR